MRDFEQFNGYPCLKHLYIMLAQDNNTWGEKRADTVVCYLNRDLKRIKKCNLNKETKRQIYLMVRREYIQRLDDITRLNQDNKNSLKGYIIARTKELRGKQCE